MTTTTPPPDPARPKRSVHPGTSLRFTIDGSDELENHLEWACGRILIGLRGLIPASKLEAVLLGGGYGRGEGGVLRDASGEHPYNDLDFYVFVQGNRRLNEGLYRRSIDVLGEILSSLVGVHVEFKITSLAELARTSVSMFSYDLVARHRWIFGREDLLAHCEHHRQAGDIPSAEAARLLMNRCSGLLFAREKLEKPHFTVADADFIRRNIAKAQLAFGDAVLTAHGKYHWSCVERHRRLEHLALLESSHWLTDVCAHHAAGVRFKLHPQRSRATKEELQSLLSEVSQAGKQSWLKLEERRLGICFPTARDYAENPISKCPTTTPSRNLLANLHALGLHPLLEFKPWLHPRQRIFHALALLLWEPDTLTSPCLLQRLRGELHTRGERFAELVSAYQTLWSRVS